MAPVALRCDWAGTGNLLLRTRLRCFASGRGGRLACVAASAANHALRTPVWTPSSTMCRTIQLHTQSCIRESAACSWNRTRVPQGSLPQRIHRSALRACCSAPTACRLRGAREPVHTAMGPCAAAHPCRDARSAPRRRAAAVQPLAKHRRLGRARPVLRRCQKGHIGRCMGLGFSGYASIYNTPL